MRRALKAIVPSEILERKRKAYVSRGPIANLRREQQKIETLFSNSLSAEYGFIDQDRFLRAFRAEIIGDVKWVGHLSRTIEVELWLRSLAARQATIRFETSSLRKPNELLPDPNRANELREYNAAC
jgi:asparagine synthase (glutamine-hydrolysing)